MNDIAYLSHNGRHTRILAVFTEEIPFWMGRRVAWGQYLNRLRRMSRALDSWKCRFLPGCGKIFIAVAALTLFVFTLSEIVAELRRHTGRREADASTTESAPPKNPFTEIAEDVYLVHTIRDRRNQGEEIRALVYAKAPNYNVECGMKSGIRMRASWYELGDNGQSLWRAFYITCNLPDIFFEDMIVESLSFVEHLPNEEAPRLGHRVTGADIDYDLTFLDPLEFEHFFGLCATLLEPKDYTAEDITEYVELNRRLGAQRITFIVSREALTPQIFKALDYYKDDPLVELVDFLLPFPASEVENNGENVARDICLHRHMQTTEFVGFTTLREFILPLENATITEALNDYPYYESGLIKISAVNVQERSNAYPLSLTNKFGLEILDHSITRGIVRPRKVVEMGSTFAYHLLNSGRMIVFENNARHFVVFRLTEESSASESTEDDSSIVDAVPSLDDVYDEISRVIESIQPITMIYSVSADKPIPPTYDEILAALRNFSNAEQRINICNEATERSVASGQLFTRSCTVCHDPSPAQRIAFGCGHLSCSDCATRVVNKCPICHSGYLALARIYEDEHFSRQCAICLTDSPFCRAVFGECGHISCTACAVKLMNMIAGTQETKVTCPFCRMKSAPYAIIEGIVERETDEANQ